eukprot:747877-Amphidinium_carterae.1
MNDRRCSTTQAVSTLVCECNHCLSLSPCFTLPLRKKSKSEQSMAHAVCTAHSEDYIGLTEFQGTPFAIGTRFCAPFRISPQISPNVDDSTHKQQKKTRDGLSNPWFMPFVLFEVENMYTHDM